MDLVTEINRINKTHFTLDEIQGCLDKVAAKHNTSRDGVIDILRKKCRKNPLKFALYNFLEVLPHDVICVIFSYIDIGFFDTSLVCKSFNKLIKRISVTVIDGNFPHMRKLTNSNLCELKNLNVLDVRYNTLINNTGISNLKSLTHLKVVYSKNITVKGITNLPNLTSLNINGNSNFEGVNINKLTQLKELILHDHRTLKSPGNVRNISNLTLLTCLKPGEICGIETLTQLKSLDLTLNRMFVDKYLNKSTQLTTLKLGDNTKITDECISLLRSLTCLNLSGNCVITDRGISELYNLESLDLSYQDDNITNDGIKGLTKLSTLNLSGNCVITDDGLERLTCLTDLKLFGHTYVTDIGLSMLPQLKCLDISYNSNITSKYIIILTTLKSLNINNCLQFTKAQVSKLTHLTHLGVSHLKINDETISGLTNLRSIGLGHGNTGITTKGLDRLSSLTYIDIDDGYIVSKKYLLRRQIKWW